VRLGIEGCSSKTSSCKEQNSTSHNNTNSPVREKVKDVDLTLLSSVGEVVVTRAHVIVWSLLTSRDVHSDGTTIKVLGGSIELHAVLNILFEVVFVVTVLGEQFFVGQAVLLIQEGHSLSEVSSKEGLVLLQPLIRSWDVGSHILDLDNVASVGLISTFTSVTCWVGITTGPLEVDVISNTDSQIIRNKVVFDGRVGLDDVSSLTTDVQVVDSSSAWDLSSLSWADVEDVRSVLEGSSELGGIKS